MTTPRPRKPRLPKLLDGMSMEVISDDPDDYDWAVYRDGVEAFFGDWSDSHTIKRMRAIGDSLVKAARYLEARREWERESS